MIKTPALAACLAAGTLWAAVPALAVPPEQPKGMNYSCGAWGASTKRPGFQCRVCTRCRTTPAGEIDCQTIEKQTQCTDGPTGDVPPPPPKEVGPRPPFKRPPAVAAPPTRVNPN